MGKYHVRNATLQGSFEEQMIVSRLRDSCVVPQNDDVEP